MTKLQEGKYTVITMDEALYSNVKMLQRGKDGRIQERGDHATVGEIFGETTADNIMKGKL